MLGIIEIELIKKIHQAGAANGIEDPFFSLALDVKQVPSSPTLRQRFNGLSQQKGECESPREGTSLPWPQN